MTLYDTAGEGSVGLKGSEQGVTVGLHGNGMVLESAGFNFFY